MTDLARELGVTRQAVQDLYRNGRLPAPDFFGPRDAPLWTHKHATQIVRDRRR